MDEMDEVFTKLSKLFDKGFDINEELMETSLSTNDRQYQNKVLEAIKALEESTHLVNELSLFSSNESVEEIATKSMKFLLLPALLADLTLKSQMTDRSEILKTSEIYFNDFIQRLNDHQICDIELNHSDGSDAEPSRRPRMTPSASLESAVHNRNDKIQRYRAQKEMEAKLKDMRTRMAQTVTDIDDEILRDYYSTLLKRWVNHSLEELNSISTEKPILEHMKQMKALNKETKQPIKSTKSDARPLKPIIITRDQFQKKVFGLGYPSIPTVSVDDFINKKLEEGSLAITDPTIYDNSLLNWAQNPYQKLLEDEQIDQTEEELIERDDPRNLRKTREWDDWKDDHKRGEGNRKNMG